MYIKMFDENHEIDLEEVVNEFLKNDIEVIDIKYQLAIMMDLKEQIYCYSAMVIYKPKSKN